jgi:hypothetical protein
VAKAKKVDTEALMTKLRAAAKEADATADAAAKAFIANSILDDRGHIGDSAGYAVIYVVNPSYHFRKALLALDPRAKSSPGRYILPVQYEKRRTEQSYWFHTRSCEAALHIWRQHFPDEEFTVQSWGD